MRRDIRRVHIDTDPGLDDLVAIALALAMPELEVTSFTTVAGNASIETVTDNLLRFLALAGVDVPVGRGASGPLSLERVDAETFHGVDGRAGIPLPEVPRGELPTAAEVLRHSLRENEIDRLIALGPLTNIAALACEDANLLRGTEIVWMGGTLGAGNITPVAEFNAYADPQAVQTVFDADLAVRVIGLDVTDSVVVRRSERENVPLGPSPMGKTLDAILSAMMRSEEAVLGAGLAVLHDPSAVVAAAFTNLFRYENKTIRVGCAEDGDRGRMRVADGDVDGATVSYAVEVHASEVVRTFRRSLARWCEATR